jgi:hypothetical protein
VAANGSRFPPLDPARELARERIIIALFAQACSAPPSAALRPRFAAQLPMSVASLAAMKAAESGRSSNPQGHKSSTSLRVPWSRRSLRAFRRAPTHQGTRRLWFARRDLERITALFTPRVRR